MNWNDWYTDTVDIYRVTAATQNNLTTHSRELVQKGVPCRVYQNSPKVIGMTQTAANTNDDSMLACGNSADIRAGTSLSFTGAACLMPFGPSPESLTITRSPLERLCLDWPTSRSNCSIRSG